MMGDEFYSLTMILEDEALQFSVAGMNSSPYFIAACAVMIAREENA